MLGVEHVVDGGEADVLVAAAVAGDEVRVEQLVVVGAGGSERPIAGRRRQRVSDAAPVWLSTPDWR